MRLSVIFSLAGAGMAAAFPLPEGAVDGVYTLKKGATEPELLLEHNTTDTSAALTKRGIPISKTGCNDILMDSVNYEQALADFTTTCGERDIPAESGLVAIVGSAQVFACSWGGENPCRVEEIDEIMGHLDGECGNLVQGGVLIDDWAKAIGRGIIGSKSCW